DMLEGDSLNCHGCSIGCIESKQLSGKRHMVAEHVTCLGARCLIDDMEALSSAYDLCNRYGIDSMSVGGVVAFAMELYEKGILDAADTGGIDLKWGNAGAMLTLVRQIGERQGLGVLLAHV
ncbi:MAG: aldehyde ferredoxin oxidoreductase C-terminal domain-containing protein, partial [Chloroflexota bacterium]